MSNTPQWGDHGAWSDYRQEGVLLHTWNAWVTFAREASAVRFYNSHGHWSECLWELVVNNPSAYASKLHYFVEDGGEVRTLCGRKVDDDPAYVLTELHIGDQGKCKRCVKKLERGEA